MWIDGREWKLVPAEPTPDWIANLSDKGLRIGRLESAIEDMLAAAPAPLAQASGQEGPSDEELLELGKQVELSIDPRYEFMDIARSLLSRYRNSDIGQAPAASAEPAINGYTCTVPDDCETLHWRGQILSMNELASMAQPAVGEEIHVHIEGKDVLTLPLASSGMGAPRFVVHVPAQPAASAERLESIGGKQ